MKKSFWKDLTSLICTTMGTGIGYMAAQCGSLAYIAAREIANLSIYGRVAALPEILRDYAVYTSAAALIGEVGGYVFHKKFWKILRGE